jgi:TPR repeat protein
MLPCGHTYGKSVIDDLIRRQGCYPECRGQLQPLAKNLRLGKAIEEVIHRESEHANFEFAANLFVEQQKEEQVKLTPGNDDGDLEAQKAAVYSFLVGAGLGEHVEQFKKERIDSLTHAKLLDDSNLRELGLPMGHRVMFRHRVSELTNKKRQADAPLAPAPAKRHCDDKDNGSSSSSSSSSSISSSSITASHALYNLPDWQAASRLLHSKKGRTAIPHLIAAANQGNPSACVELWVLYGGCCGVATDVNRRKEWRDRAVAALAQLRAAEVAGIASAQLCLGWMAAEGMGMVKDLKEAVRLYRLSADQGDASAQCNLGYCFRTGTGVEQDLNEAVRYYRLSADQGDVDAQCNLGYCLYTGTGVNRNYKEAARYYRLAADQGYQRAQRQLASCYEQGKGVSKSQRQADLWRQRAAAE